jgi:hypothetical protein
MGGIPNASPPVPLAPGKWIGKIILAVVLGEAIWGLLVSLTNGLIVPGLARVMGADPQSPVYLGNGSFQLTGIFVSVLELCLAGIVALVLNQWSSGVAGTRVRTIKVRTVATKGSMPSIAPSAPAATPVSVAKSAPTAAPEPAPVAVAAAVAVQPARLPAPPTPAAALPSAPATAKPAAPAARPAAPAKSSKPKKPAEVYYNIVGEPINPTEDDE